MSESKSHRKQVEKALKDDYLQMALNRAEAAYRKARAAAMEGFDLSASQQRVREVKERSIAGLDELFARFKAEAEAVGARVYEAAGGSEAAAIVQNIAASRSAELIVKSKSMLTEEIELNSRLEKAGLKVVETDLGEWIIQLAHEKPSHFTAPALHKTREQIAALFSEVTGEELDPDVQALVDVARRELRQAFIDADIGISGANAAIADTGTLVIVANEGNDRLVTTLPPVHIAIVGYEKLVESMDDAAAILKVLARSGTGQKQTAYVSFITGPSRTTDIEKTLTLGVHGPKELHIIFVDAGRKAMAADESCKEALYCIKCGACLNLCPAYRSVGGHAYGNAYMGGIGSIVTTFHRDLKSAEDTLALCTGCGYCREICPAKIDTPRMVVELRKRLVRKQGMPMADQVSMAMLRHPGFFQKAMVTAQLLQRPLLDTDGFMNDLPVVSGVMQGRKVPGLAPQMLSELLPEREEGSGTGVVALYSGCLLEYLYPEIGESIWKVLTKSAMTAVLPQDQCCCGAPAFYLGDHATARQLAALNIAAMEKSSPDYIVTGCPTCAVMLKEQFPLLLRGTEWENRAAGLAPRVMDFSQFASDVMDLHFDRSADVTVTYHDPCHQVRGLRTSDCSRRMLQEAGAELVEMRDCDECCGFAGSYAIKQSGISNSILQRKIANIEETSAEVVATDCPGCILQIRGGLAARGKRIKVCHTVEILARLME